MSVSLSFSLYHNILFLNFIYISNKYTEICLFGTCHSFIVINLMMVYCHGFRKTVKKRQRRRRRPRQQQQQWIQMQQTRSRIVMQRQWKRNEMLTNNSEQNKNIRTHARMHEKNIIPREKKKTKNSNREIRIIVIFVCRTRSNGCK